MTAWLNILHYLDIFTNNHNNRASHSYCSFLPCTAHLGQFYRKTVSSVTFIWFFLFLLRALTVKLCRLICCHFAASSGNWLISSTLIFSTSLHSNILHLQNILNQNQEIGLSAHTLIFFTSLHSNILHLQNQYKCVFQWLNTFYIVYNIQTETKDRQTHIVFINYTLHCLHLPRWIDILATMYSGAHACPRIRDKTPQKPHLSLLLCKKHQNTWRNILLQGGEEED